MIIRLLSYLYCSILVIATVETVAFHVTSRAVSRRGQQYLPRCPTRPSTTFAALDRSQTLQKCPRISSRSASVAGIPSSDITGRDDEDVVDTKGKIKGDSIRAVTGIRPSLHPVTINALAEALRIRALSKSEIQLQVSDKVAPLQVALAAGKIAAEYVQRRQKTSDKDDMKLTDPEEQTIAGRVVGVVMRMVQLEQTLSEKCHGAGWIAKYGEWHTFGLLPNEKIQTTGIMAVNERIQSDPLFRISRAECLLALFIKEVEIPSLEKNGQQVPDNSKIDFLDEDRRSVLLS